MQPNVTAIATEKKSYPTANFGSAAFPDFKQLQTIYNQNCLAPVM